MDNILPKDIVKYLDEYVIGQDDAKKTIALALRNRYRRMRVEPSIQDEIMPKNILMIGSTGIGKTEIARRLSKLMRIPFLKVEASKYTEVGFVGRDVESMVRDLLFESINIVKEEHKERNKDEIEDYVLNKIAEILVSPPPSYTTEAKKEEYKNTLSKIKIKIINGDFDNTKIKIDLPNSDFDLVDNNVPPEFAKAQESIMKLMSNINKKNVQKEVFVKDAKEILKLEADEKLLDNEAIRKEALKRAGEGGIIFLDEIDKIASSNDKRSDPSKEGVQRDLLPIVEGSTVNTKYGQLKTDHILFIAAGAFHLSKPGDLIPELQGRFPLRVELKPLDEKALYQILKTPKNSLLKQYQALLSVEGVDLLFKDEAILLMAKLANRANEKMQDIGARRLHTVIEKLMEDISFDADLYNGQTVSIDEKLVNEKLKDLIDDEDKARYIL